MKALAQVLVLFVLMLTGTSASADTVTVVYPRFTLDYLPPSDHVAPDIPDLQLLSDVDGATTFTLPRFDWFQSNYGVVDYYQLSMRLLPQTGYQIIGYALTGQAIGTLWSEQPPPNVNVYRLIPPKPHNSVLFGLGGYQTFRDFDGERDISLGGFWPGTTDYAYLDVTLGSNAWRELGWYYTSPADDGHRLEATSTIAFSDLRLTVYTSLIPIPEPRTWAMLLLGLAPLAWRCRLNRISTASSQGGTPCNS